MLFEHVTKKGHVRMSTEDMFCGVMRGSRQSLTRLHPILDALYADIRVDRNLAKAQREIRHVLKHDLVPSYVNEAAGIV